MNSPLGSFEVCGQAAPVEKIITDNIANPNFGSQPTRLPSVLTSTECATIFFKTMGFLPGAAWGA